MATRESCEISQWWTPCVKFKVKEQKNWGKKYIKTRKAIKSIKKSSEDFCYTENQKFFFSTLK